MRDPSSAPCESAQIFDLAARTHALAVCALGHLPPVGEGFWVRRFAEFLDSASLLSTRFFLMGSPPQTTEVFAVGRGNQQSAACGR